MVCFKDRVFERCMKMFAKLYLKGSKQNINQESQRAKKSNKIGVKMKQLQHKSFDWVTFCICNLMWISKKEHTLFSLLNNISSY